MQPTKTGGGEGGARRVLEVLEGSAHPRCSALVSPPPSSPTSHVLSLPLPPPPPPPPLPPKRSKRRARETARRGYSGRPRNGPGHSDARGVGERARRAPSSRRGAAGERGAGPRKEIRTRTEHWRIEETNNRENAAGQAMRRRGERGAQCRGTGAAATGGMKRSRTPRNGTAPVPSQH